MNVLLWFFGVFGVAAGGAALLTRAALGVTWLERLHPRTRARVFIAASFVPLLVGGAVLAATFVPQTWLGLPDHCLGHAHHLHLCVSCGVPNPPALFSALTMFYAAWVGYGLIANGTNAARARRALGRLSAARASRGSLNVLPVPGLVAFVAGFVRPQVYVSGAAAGPEWSAVQAHERDHARHRDPLARLLVRLALVVAPPGLAPWIERRLTRAQELAADEAAALEVGDRITVAEQVLAWAREKNRAPELALAFGDGDVEERIRVLMDEPAYLDGPSRSLLAGAASAGAIAVGLLAPSIHHGVEELFHLLDHHH